MAFQIVQRAAGCQLKTAPYLQLCARTAASKSVILELIFCLFFMLAIHSVLLCTV